MKPSKLKQTAFLAILALLCVFTFLGTHYRLRARLMGLHQNALALRKNLYLAQDSLIPQSQPPITSSFDGLAEFQRRLQLFRAMDPKPSVTNPVAAPLPPTQTRFLDAVQKYNAAAYLFNIELRKYPDTNLATDLRLTPLPYFEPDHRFH